MAGDPYAGEKLDCDIVMKGGITSGVVYPGAVSELAERYRFRSIGGTSAGAIAAAIVAAAEHRRRGGSTEGFRRVKALPEELAGRRDGALLLLRLFQPDPPTRRLFAAMLGFMRHGARGGVLRLPRAFPRFPALAVVVAAAAVALWLAAGAPPGVAIAGAAAALLLAPAGLLADLVRAVLRLPANDFGLCTLGPGSVGPAGQPALTMWLHRQLQEAAGRAVDGPVLTFADLWGVDPAERDPAERLAAMVERSRDPQRREVDLQMVTTDLTHGRPWRLPSPYQQGQDVLEYGGGLLFRPDELGRYFPETVVCQLEEAGAPIGAGRAALLPDGGRAFRRFPIGPDLPVVVATRMSLSFPGLISAIPLWNLDFEDDPPRLERVVFSDGGITSNFPVHFFDAPLPRRPTFGLHLTSFPPGERPPEGEQAQDRAVVPPPPVEGRAPEEPREIVTLGQFFVAIKDAMQNWRDNAQARQPGFRDRMVHIRLGAQEGGLNLTMDRQKVLDLSARGGAAARVLIGRFAQPAAGAGVGTPWNDHRFVRFRITMAVLEEYLGAFGTAWSQPGDAVTVPYPARVDTGIVKPYKFTLTQRAQALLRAHTYDMPVPEDPAQRLTRGAPRPPSVLRTVPPT